MLSSLKFINGINKNASSFLASSFSSAVLQDIPELSSVDFRTVQSTRKCQLLRNNNQIPGLLFGKDNNNNDMKLLISIGKKELEKIARERGRSLECTLFDLKLPDGTEHLVTPWGLQRDPINDDPLSLNFRTYRSGQRLNVPVVYINEEMSTDIRRGSFILRVVKNIDITCDQGINIPSSLKVDLSGRKKNDVIRINDIEFPKGVKPSKKMRNDLVLAKISRG